MNHEIRACFRDMHVFSSTVSAQLLRLDLGSTLMRDGLPPVVEQNLPLTRWQGHG